MNRKQRRKLIVLSVVMLFTCVLCYSKFLSAAEGKAQNLVNCEDPSEWKGMVKVNTQIKRYGKGSFELYGKYATKIISSRMIPIDMNKTYTFSAWMRTLDKQLPASANMGLFMYDKNKKPILMRNVGISQGTETTLSTSVAKGAKELRIVKNAKWLNRTHAVAFNAEAEYQDLPNFDISSRIKNVIDEGEQYRIILSKALKRAYPAGTKVRLHFPFGVPFYLGADGWMPTEWKKFSVTMAGEALCGIPGNKFWQGTKYVRIFVWFGNWNRKPKKGARLLVDDIKFISSPTPRVKVVGNLEWPSQWRVFGPMCGDDRLNENRLNDIASKIKINGKKFIAKDVKTIDNKLDFQKIYGKFKMKRVAYVFGTIVAPQDGDVTLGMGADWWMQVWVDGKLICDTTASGNANWPPTISDHKRMIHLSKGKHILAVRFISGKGSSVLALGGPDQLRSKEKKK